MGSGLQGFRVEGLGLLRFRAWDVQPGRFLVVWAWRAQVFRVKATDLRAHGSVGFACEPRSPSISSLETSSEHCKKGSHGDDIL